MGISRRGKRQRTFFCRRSRRHRHHCQPDDTGIGAVPAVCSAADRIASLQARAARRRGSRGGGGQQPAHQVHGLHRQPAGRHHQGATPSQAAEPLRRCGAALPRGAPPRNRPARAAAPELAQRPVMPTLVCSTAAGQPVCPVCHPSSVKTQYIFVTRDI